MWYTFGHVTRGYPGAQNPRSQVERGTHSRQSWDKPRGTPTVSVVQQSSYGNAYEKKKGLRPLRPTVGNTVGITLTTPLSVHYPIKARMQRGGVALTETLGAQLEVASLLGDVAEAHHRAPLATRPCFRVQGSGFRVWG
jgi:hypothetical protein